jgi:hypothetical protein
MHCIRRECRLLKTVQALFHNDFASRCDVHRVEHSA